MYYTVYKTTNKINGKIYIGCHKTKDLDDGYIGSGTLLKRAVEKHGIENFEKEIIAVFDRASEMFEMESELVNEDFVKDDTNYNLKIGGSGGWDFINDNNLSNRNIDVTQKRDAGRIGIRVLQEKIKNDPIYKKEIYGKIVQTRKERFETGEIVPSFAGKKHSDETKRKIGESNSMKQRGSKNSQYGKMWIFNPTTSENKMIMKNDALPEGWTKGRKIKK